MEFNVFKKLAEVAFLRICDIQLCFEIKDCESKSKCMHSWFIDRVHTSDHPEYAKKGILSVIDLIEHDVEISNAELIDYAKKFCDDVKVLLNYSERIMAKKPSVTYHLILSFEKIQYRAYQGIWV